MTLQQLHWFEKTVEYAFVLKHAPQLTHAMPLAGNHEKAGDAIFEIPGTKWILIEFKRAKGDLSSEQAKYLDYAAARSALETRGRKVHFFVYAEICGKDLFLEAARYWDRALLATIGLLLKQEGTSNREEFESYLSEVSSHKRGGGQGSGGPDFSVVAAVDANGQLEAIASTFELLGPAHEPNAGYDFSP